MAASWTVERHAKRRRCARRAIDQPVCPENGGKSPGRFCAFAVRRGLHARAHREALAEAFELMDLYLRDDRTVFEAVEWTRNVE